MADFARVWQAADKVVYSTTLEAVSTARSRLERRFDPDAVGTTKVDASRALMVGGANLAAHALRAGLVDECRLFVHRVMVGRGKPALPSDVRVNLVECNITPGAPPGQLLPLLPASCTTPGGVGNGAPFLVVAPTPPVTDASGSLTTAFTVKEGNVGASQQTIAYPCPPTAANVAAGGSCGIVVVDGAYDTGATPITLTGPVPKPSVVVFPAGGLRNGSVVGVVGSRFVPLLPGAILECNDTPGQPTVPIDGFPAMVGCTNPFNDGGVAGTNPSGEITGSIHVQTGVIGPIQAGTDSAGHDAATYPCPPTAAEQAAGLTCEILVGDLTGDGAAEPIAFASSSPGYPAAPGAGLAPAQAGGYWTVGSDGGVFGAGGAPFLGSLPGLHVRPAAPVVDIVSTPDGRGYWLLSSDGGVYGFGDARYWGSLPQLGLRHAPAVALAPTIDGQGYWIVAGDGGVFAFGDASFLGSILSQPPPGPPGQITVVGAAADPGGQGYWLLGSDGGLFRFGAVGGKVAPGVPLPPGVPIPVKGGTAGAAGRA